MSSTQKVTPPAPTGLIFLFDLLDVCEISQTHLSNIPDPPSYQKRPLRLKNLHDDPFRCYNVLHFVVYPLPIRCFNLAFPPSCSVNQSICIRTCVRNPWLGIPPCCPKCMVLRMLVSYRIARCYPAASHFCGCKFLVFEFAHCILIRLFICLINV